MKDSNDENLEKDNSEETSIFSDRELEDSLKVEGKYSKGGQTPTEADLPPQILPFLKSQTRLRHSKRLIVLLCFGLGILGLVILFAMKPEVEEPQVAATGTKRPIPSIEGKKGPAIPRSIRKKGKEEKPSEGGVLERKKPVVSKPVETPLMSHGKGAEKRAGNIGGTELLKRDKGDKVTEVEGEKPYTKAKGEGKSQVAKAVEPKSRTIPKQKSLSGKFTINVGSFRDRVRAERLMKELKGKGYKAFVAEATIPQKGTWYRVSVGRFPSRREAQAFAQELRDKKGIDSFVRALGEAKR